MGTSRRRDGLRSDPMGGFLTWTESVVYAFTGKRDGAHPQTQLVVAKLGKGQDIGLLGTAMEGGKSVAARFSR